MTTGYPAISPEILDSFQKVFDDFQARAEKLSTAYDAMREDFRNINIELDKKNSDLITSLAREEKMQTYLDSILQSMENGVVGIDPSGTITRFNRAASEATGFSASEIINQPYIRFFGGKTSNEPDLLRILNGNMPSITHNEKVIWHKDGHPVPVSFHHSLLCDKNGTRIGAVEIFTDISKIKALEKEMHQAKTMAALGEMSATVAHEIRNPLGAMGMWAALLERDLDSEDPRRKTLGKIVEGLSKLNKIVSNLLVFTRPVNAELVKVNLSSIIGEVVDFVKIEIERLERSINVVEDTSGTKEIWALVDPEKISQLLLNLCLNSIQAMSDGGELRIALYCSHGGYAVLEVADTGKGIERDNLSKIFDPFFTTKENGTGLGLAIVKKFVEFHAGYIDVASETGKGTMVKAFIPQLRE